MDTRLTSLFLAGTAAVAVSLGCGSAYATSWTGVCPDVSGHTAISPGGAGSATGCTIGISINSSSIVINTATSVGGDTNFGTGGGASGLAYESNEDVLVGVKNTGTGTLGGVTLTGTGLFAFEGDGIDGYAGISRNSKDTSCAAGGGVGTSCYGGPDSFFTGITAGHNKGVVNFINPLTPGETTYFSLEEPTSGGICTTTTQCPHFSSAPEPTSLALLGSGLLGLAGLRRMRRRRRS